MRPARAIQQQSSASLLAQPKETAEGGRPAFTNLPHQGPKRSGARNYRTAWRRSVEVVTSAPTTRQPGRDGCFHPERDPRGADQPRATDGSARFPNIAGHRAEAWVEQLYDEGIASGYPDGTFRPDKPATRTEMAVFLVRAFSLPPL